MRGEGRSRGAPSVDRRRTTSGCTPGRSPLDHRRDCGFHRSASRDTGRMSTPQKRIRLRRRGTSRRAVARSRRACGPGMTRRRGPTASLVVCPWGDVRRARALFLAGTGVHFRPLTTGDGSGTARPGRGQGFLGTGGRPALTTRSQHLLGIYRLSDPALSDLTLERLLDELLIRIREILSVDTAAVLLLDWETRELVARAAKGIEEEVEQGVRIPLGRGFAGRIATERMPIFIADVDHADVLNPILRAKGIRSLLGVPLMLGGRALGVLHVGTLRPRNFTNADAAILQLAAARASPAIERAQLLDALEHEHLGAVALQSSLLPDVLPNIATADVAARYLPSRDVVGGDWYDVLDLGDGRIGLAIGDVAGHGVRAAALMGQLRTALRAYALEGHSPGETLRRVDALLHATRARGMATAAYAVVDPESGQLTIAAAGHPP